ncbi:MAG: transposase [Acinetobacter bohemicus]
MLVACVDRLKGFPDAIASVYPHTDIQLYIVHVVRNSLRFCQLERLQSSYSRLKSDLPSQYRRKRTDSPEYLL